LQVTRRAPAIWQKLKDQPGANEPERLFDWLNVYAMAVNEENAAGGQVVTAPTNGAAGILPSILRHYCLKQRKPGPRCAPFPSDRWRHWPPLQAARFDLRRGDGLPGRSRRRLLDGGGGTRRVWGGSPQQVANAAEIGMEHNLGLTCDPVGGLVQIPCIERNAVGSVKAVNGARLSLHSDTPSKVSLDQVIETMRQTGVDMSSKYKETSQGGLAVNVVEC
jgi:L-serine dehydratase